MSSSQALPPAGISREGRIKEFSRDVAEVSEGASSARSCLERDLSAVVDTVAEGEVSLHSFRS